MSNHIGARRCFICQISTVQGPRRRNSHFIRSYLLTENYIATHPNIMIYAQSLFGDRQMTAEDRICRPCLQRADRYVVAQRIAQEQAEAELAAQQAATDEMFEPSPGPSSAEASSDPLRTTPETIPQNVPAEAPEDIPEEQEIPEQEIPHTQIVPLISLTDYSRVPYSSRNCIIAGCHRHPAQTLHRINLIVRLHILSKEHIYIPQGTRICSEHLESGALWLDDFVSLCRSTYDTFNSAQITDMLKMLDKKGLQYLNFQQLDTIEDSVFYFYIGYSKQIFLNVLDETPSIIDTFKRPKLALATVLCKLHTGDSNERLSTIFRLSPQHFGLIMRNVRKCLIEEFVPKHLGFDHIYGPGSGSTYREQLRERILLIPHILFSSPNGQQLISICDGTYFYVQKSSNYSFQRRSYSSHKYRNLLKVFLIVSPDGYILESFGPYEATKSDATIMEELISETEDNVFHWFYEKEDIFILDRGFRDVMDKISEVGYKAYMPQTKDDNERQLTTQQANDSRKVTLCRWVVETINGRLKNQFRQLRSQYVNIAAPHLYEVVRIGCALINAFGKRLTDHHLADDIINQIYLKYDMPNRLSELVLRNNFNQRRAAFQAIDASEGFQQFPCLTYDELLIISLGPYQVAQARSYYAEHTKVNGTFVIEVYEDIDVDYDLSQYGLVVADPWIARARIQSRHHSHRVYFVYILLDNSLEGRYRIVGHYCNCLVGKRTLGCCAHVMCIIWYMAWARHQDIPIQAPASFLDDIIVSNED